MRTSRLHRVRKIAGGIALPILATLAACSGGDDGGPIDVAVVEDTQNLLTKGVRLSYGQQLVRGAISEGLVTQDATGETVPALAESWIVTDEGRSFIFRLRDTRWADGTTVDAASVRAAMRRKIAALEGTSLGLDLARIDEIRAMTGRVIEIRLSQPMPAFLQLLSQPELGLGEERGGSGPMQATVSQGAVLLAPLPPETRGLPEEPDFAERARPVRIRALDAAPAVEAFNSGEIDLVVGGTLATLPLAESGPLSSGNLRLDSALGLFGLQVVRKTGFLADADRREVIAMAIDRSTLLDPFNLSQWPSTTRVVPIDLWSVDQAGAPVTGADGQPLRERWADLALEARRARAARRVADWQASSGQQPAVSIQLPAGPGSERLFRRLADDLATVGLTARRATDARDADLVLIDRLARYAAPRWFLNQFNCAVRQVSCVAQADAYATGATAVAGQGTQTRPLAAAEALLVDANLYIPLGAPVRWSLVRGGLDGFTENRWASHPLFPLSVDPIS